jgi:divalent metal cation (Fe/Co/Zn/Cd) transporter
MDGPAPALRCGQLLRQLRILFWASLAWLVLVGAIGLAAGIAAGSVALIGWGVDCAIQAVAAVVILWRFSGTRVQAEQAERLAQRVVGASFVLLVPYIAVVAGDQLLTGNAPQASWTGITVAAIDVGLMPLLGRAKTTLGAQLGSPATVAAGKQNVLCAYLSIAVLAGLAANAIFGLWWADPVAALLVASACVQTGSRTWRGAACA